MLSIKLSATIHYSTASSSSCQVYPSEYAYRDDSVTRAESASANCRRYLSRDAYIHCDGEQLKVSDSDRGSNTEYLATSYCVWTAGSADHLLFIFPTRVSLTIITLHYYSDSVRGLPRLRVYAVPDDFDVWDALLTSGNPYGGVASVRPGGEPAGRRTVRINVNFNTKRILIYMYKYSSSFSFALSEVEFNNSICTYSCTCKCTACTSIRTIHSVICYFIGYRTIAIEYMASMPSTIFSDLAVLNTTESMFVQEYPNLLVFLLHHALLTEPVTENGFGTKVSSSKLTAMFIRSSFLLLLHNYRWRQWTDNTTGQRSKSV